MSPRHSASWAWYGLAAFVVLMPWSATVGPAHVNLQWSDLAALGFLVISARAGLWRGAAITPVWWAAAIYLGALLPSFWATPHVSASLLEWLKTAYVVGLGFAIARWAAAPPAWYRLVRVFAAVTAAVILLALGTWVYATLSGHVPEQLAVHMDVPNVGQVVRVKALLYTPTFLANYLTLGLPILFGYAAWAAPWPRPTCWLLLGAGLVAAALTASHSLAGCLTALGLVMPREKWGTRLVRRGLLVLAAGTVLFGLVATTFSVYAVEAHRAPAAGAPAVACDHDFLGPQGTGEELTLRIHYGQVVYGWLKRFAWEAWQRHPWVGIGLNQFPHEVVAAFQAQRIHAYYAGGADPHSTWLGALAETGLVGVVGLLGFWGVFLRTAVGALRRLPLGERWRLQAPLAGVAGLLVNSLHVDIMHFRFLWMGVALVLSAAAPRRRGSG